MLPSGNDEDVLTSGNDEDVLTSGNDSVGSVHTVAIVPVVPNNKL